MTAIDPREYTGDPEPLRKAFAKAAELEVREGDRIEKDVRGEGAC